MARVTRKSPNSYQKYFLILVLTFLIVVAALVLYFLNQPQDIRSKAYFNPTRPSRPTIAPRPTRSFPRVTPPPVTISPPSDTLLPWLDQSRVNLRNSSWFNTHRYIDCPKTNGGFWPAGVLDCVIPDELGGPSQDDLAIVKDPPGLFYKHMSPSDFLYLLPGTQQRMIIQRGIMSGLKDVIGSNYLLVATMSVDSLMIGIEGGVNGDIIRSASLMVHPDYERPISKAAGGEKNRADILYKPFIDGATGLKISSDDVYKLYDAALNRCGEKAIDGDQSGYGTKVDIGDYVAVVQYWMEGGDGTKDCNIHVVRKGS